MIEEIKKWWEENSKTFQEESQVPVGITYGPCMPTEEKLKLLGNLKGKNVLEIGCGGAQCGIGFAKEGSKVIGIDLSEEQLKYARNLSEQHNVKIELLQGDIKNLKQIKSNTQDIVFSAWALFYVDDLEKCFKEVYRVLKKKGIFVFSTIHPFWKVIESKSLKTKRSYYDTGKYENPDNRGLYVCYTNTISNIFNNLISAGFLVEKILEPDQRINDKYTSKEIVPEDYKREAMKFIPRTIIFKTRKEVIN
ncbi:MAG: class I SAM-dependent methyltransferase [Nanoarchaeota archaeon]